MCSSSGNKFVYNIDLIDETPLIAPSKKGLFLENISEFFDKEIVQQVFDVIYNKAVGNMVDFSITDVEIVKGHTVRMFKYPVALCNLPAIPIPGRPSGYSLSHAYFETDKVLCFVYKLKNSIMLERLSFDVK